MTKAVLGPRQQKKRQKIIDCATEVFLQQGYSETSMNGLIRMVGGSKATLYAHFSSKDELFDAVIEKLITNLRAELDIGSLEGMALDDYIKQVAEIYRQKVETEEVINLVRLLIEATRTKPELAHLAEQAFVSHFARQLASQLAAHPQEPEGGWQQFSLSLTRSLFSVVVSQALFSSQAQAEDKAWCPAKLTTEQHIGAVS